MSKSYFWRVKLFDNTTQEVDADFVDIKDGAIIFMNKTGVEVIYAGGTWTEVLKVTIKETKE